MAKSPAVQAAKKRLEEGRIVILSTGVRARVHAVAMGLIEACTGQVEDPKIPIWHNPDKDRDEENPSDPEYLRQLNQVNKQRYRAVEDAMVMFGVELVDGVPPKEEWMPRLEVLRRRGAIDLSGFDLEDSVDLEFVYKRFIAVGAPDLNLIRAAGVSEEEIQRALESFPGSATGDTDRGLPPEEAGP